MFVAIRVQKRQFIQSIKTRSILIGLLITSLSLIAANFLLESVGCGTPTLASPGLEIQLIAAVISGEFLVRATSRPALTYL